MLAVISVGGVFGVLAMLQSSFPHPSLPVITTLAIVGGALGLLLIVTILVYCCCRETVPAEPGRQKTPKTRHRAVTKEIGKWERCGIFNNL